MNKVALVIPRLSIGGAEKLALDTAKGLCSEGMDVTLVTFSDKMSFELPVGIQHVVTANPILLGIFFRKHDIDCCISYMAKANFWCQVARSISKTKQIITVHAAVEEGFKLRKKSVIFLTKLTYKLASIFNTKVICVSNGIKNELEKLFNLKNIDTLHNFVDVDAICFNSSLLGNRYPKTARVRIGFFGRLTKTKGVDVLVDALSISPNDVVNNLEVLVFGEGPEKATIKRMIDSNNLSKTVQLCGAVTNPYIHMKDCDFIVVPSRSEGFGLVFIEALLLGCGVLYSRCNHEPKEIAKEYFPHLDIFSFESPSASEKRSISELASLLASVSRNEFVNNPEVNFRIIKENFSKNDYLRRLVGFIELEINGDYSKRRK